MNTDDTSVSEMSIQKFPKAWKLTPFVQAIFDLMYLKTESEDQSLKDKHLSSLHSPQPTRCYLFLVCSFKQYIQAANKFIVHVL